MSQPDDVDAAIANFLNRGRRPALNMAEEARRARLARVSRRRKSNVLSHILCLKFDDPPVTGPVAEYEGMTFTPAINVEDEPTKPGFIALKDFASEVSRVATWSIDGEDFGHFEVEFPFRFLKVDLVSGNYKNLKVDISGYDEYDNPVALQTVVLDADEPKTVHLHNGFTNIRAFDFERNPLSAETLHPGAIGTDVDIGMINACAFPLTPLPV